MVAESYDLDVTDEAGWGGGNAPIDSSGNFAHLPPNERRAAKERRKRWHEKLRKAEAVRASWTAEQYEEEGRQIAAQVAEWENKRNAA